MNQDAFQIVSDALLLNEMATRLVLKRGAKKIGKSLIKDPVALFLLNPLLAVPGTNAAAVAQHLVRKKGSRKVAFLMARKVARQSKKFAGKEKQLAKLFFGRLKRLPALRKPALAAA